MRLSSASQQHVDDTEAEGVVPVGIGQEASNAMTLPQRRANLTKALNALNEAEAAVDAAREQADSAADRLEKVRARLASGDASLTADELTKAEAEVNFRSIALAGAADRRDEAQSKVSEAKIPVAVAEVREEHGDNDPRSAVAAKIDSIADAFEELFEVLREARAGANAAGEKLENAGVPERTTIEGVSYHWPKKAFSDQREFDAGFNVQIDGEQVAWRASSFARALKDEQEDVLKLVLQASLGRVGFYVGSSGSDRGFRRQ